MISDLEETRDSKLKPIIVVVFNTKASTLPVKPATDNISDHSENIITKSSVKNVLYEPGKYFHIVCKVCNLHFHTQPFVHDVYTHTHTHTHSHSYTHMPTCTHTLTHIIYIHMY